VIDQVRFTLERVERAFHDTRQRVLLEWVDVCTTHTRTHTSTDEKALESAHAHTHIDEEQPQRVLASILRAFAYTDEAHMAEECVASVLVMPILERLTATFPVCRSLDSLRSFFDGYLSTCTAHLAPLLAYTGPFAFDFVRIVCVCVCVCVCVVCATLIQ
jgi:hypothetical protein